MKIRKIFVCLALVMMTLPSFSQDQACKDEYERGKREIGAYAEMLGIIEGVIYGYSLELKTPEVCLPTEAKPRVKAIADVMMSESFRNDPVLMDDVPTRAEAQQFLKRFFACARSPSPQSGK
jgi:hypothetical protein